MEPSPSRCPLKKSIKNSVGISKAPIVRDFLGVRPMEKSHLQNWTSPNCTRWASDFGFLVIPILFLSPSIDLNITIKSMSFDVNITCLLLDEIHPSVAMSPTIYARSGVHVRSLFSLMFESYHWSAKGKIKFVVPKEGLEPSQAFAYNILSVACLPFHHFGVFFEMPHQLTPKAPFSQLVVECDKITA